MAVNAQSGSEGDGQAPLSPAERRAAELDAVDRQFRDAKPLDEVTEAIRAPGMRLPRIMATVLEGYADRPAFGERVRKQSKDPRTGRTTVELLPEFRTITYREVSQRIQALASELTNDRKSPVSPGDFVCTLGFTSSDYATVDLACIHLGLVSVPLHFSSTLAELEPIVAESAPRILAASAELLDTAVELALSSESLRRLVVFDCDMGVDEQRERFEAAAARLAATRSPVAIDTLEAMLERGHALPPAPLCTTVDEQSLTSLLYTSGSTGAPKGAMYTQRLATYLWGASWRKTDTPVISLNGLPMSHLSGRYTLFSTLSAGGTHYFTAKSDLSTLFEDMSLARPTDLMLVPRTWEMLFRQYQSEVDRRVAAGGDPAAVEAELLTEMREEMLGGRIVRVMAGSGPLDSETAAFLESCLGLKPHDGYGATEAGMITTGHKIAPVVIDHKLVDMPELGYFRTDSPYPRGELRVKTEMIMAGYYKRPEATAAAFDEEGFYKTGDIMAQTGPDEFVYVDRTNNVLKLSQGELVAVARLETVFAASPLIRQILVHGSSDRSYLLATVVPMPEVIEQAEDDMGALKASLSAELQRTAKEAGLNSYEIPRDFIVETEPFSTANGLLSDAGKLARPRGKERYGERLEQMYADLDSQQTSESSALHGGARARPN